jgi:hypothetical protein
MSPLLAMLIVGLLVAVPVALAAAPSQPLPGQRVDMKVLLIGASTTDGVYDAWKTELDRVGVPFDSRTGTAQPLTDAQVADYAANRAFYQAVIVVAPDTTLTAGDQAVLTKLQETFGIRQFSDNVYPTAAHGLSAPTTGSEQGGTTAQLTADGKSAFPYLKGPVPLAPAPVFGYGATPAPAAGATFKTLLTGAGNSTFLGVHVRPNGTEEMVNTVAGNQYQSHHQLLRDGILGWVTRGVYLGYTRNYLGLDVDDIFLPDDKWDPVNNVTDYNATIRMDAGDVTDAVNWQKRTGVKLSMVYNMGGIDLYGGASDPLLAAFKPQKNEFRWINHTLEHPNLDCSTAGYIADQVTSNQTKFNTNLGPVAAGLNDPTELVTGEHSGLANTRPGNPGTIDPPSVASEDSGAGGALPAGTYDYGISGTTAGGETPASVTQVAVSATEAPQLTWGSICNATGYRIYRKLSTATDWSLLATVPATPSQNTDPAVTPPTAAFNDNGAGEWLYTDTGSAGTPGNPPMGNGATLTAYPQNPAFIPALTTAGTKTIATDTSKSYPSPVTKAPVTAEDPTNFAPGATFVDGPAQAVPRYPTNLYYNVANRADQLDEYNWLYVSPAGGGNCQPIPDVTTCRDGPATWQEYLDSEVGIITNHVMGNDPRPHYVHQTNIAGYNPDDADTDTTEGGALYAVVNTLLKRYDASIDRTSTPLIQVSQDEVAKTLVRQKAWAADVTAGRVSGFIKDGRVHVVASTATEVPITGTTEGSAYAGTRSGWKTVAAGDTAFSPNDPADTVAPSISGAANPGVTLTATAGTWTGTGAIAKSFQWQQSVGTDGAWTNVAGATAATYALQTSDEGSRFRVAVSARNWISSVSQEFSAATAVVAKPPVATPTPTPTATPPAATKPPVVTKPPAIVRPPAQPKAKPTRVKLSRLKMAPRKFRVTKARKLGRAKSKVKLGSSINWSVNRAATMRIRVERLTFGSKKVRRRAVGTIKKSAKKGKGTLKFRGLVSRKRLAPGSYRIVVTATAGGFTSASRTIKFTIVKA